MEKKQLPKLLKAIRDRLELRQADLARALHVSYPTINRWENGKTQPTAAVLNLIRQFVLSKRNECADIIAEFFPEAEHDDDQIHVRRTPMTMEEPEEDAASDEPLHVRRTIAMLDLKTMESLLWQAACSIRGEKDAPKFKDYILPLVFIKRLSDVFEDEISRLIKTFGNEVTALENVEADHSLVRFYIPAEARWAVISGRKPWPRGRAPKTLGELVTSAIRAVAKANDSLQGVIDIVDYNETRNGERELSDNALARLIEILSKNRLGLNDVEPDFLGRAYEYLLRKFAEGQGQSAGEFFTPLEVGRLIAKILCPKQGEEAYDPCCGSGGLLIKCELDLAEREGHVAKPLKLYGQELTGASFAIARMNMVIHDMEGEIVRGNTMTNPKFREGGRLKRFDLIATNPMWSQDNLDPRQYENDPYERFSARGGFAPGSNADWAWIQHVHASLKDTGRAAIVLDVNAASRGSGTQNDNAEKLIRKWFVDKDLIDGVILLPENLFYNTSGAGIIVILNCKKEKSRKGRILLVNATSEFRKGKPKNILVDQSIERISSAFRAGCDEERFARMVSREDLVREDYSISPSLFIKTAESQNHAETPARIEELVQITSIGAKLNADLNPILQRLKRSIHKSNAKPTSGWPTRTLGDLVDAGEVIIKNGFACGEHELGGSGIPHLRPFNVTNDGRISLIQIKTISTRPGIEEFALQNGDVLYNNTNSEELVGKCAYWSGRQGLYVLSNHMTIIRPTSDALDGRFLAGFLFWCWQSGTAKTLSRRHVNQASIGLDRLRKIEIPLPDREVQQLVAGLLGKFLDLVEVSHKAISATRIMNSALIDLMMTQQIDPTNLKAPAEVGAGK